MKHEFMKLHQFLREEEEARLSALKEEEMKKVLAIKERDEELRNRISSLSDIISRTEQEIADDDLTLLQVKISPPLTLEFPGVFFFFFFSEQDNVVYDVLTDCQEKFLILSSSWLSECSVMAHCVSFPFTELQICHGEVRRIHLSMLKENSTLKNNITNVFMLKCL